MNKITVNKREWNLRSTHKTCTQWDSMWFSDDGDSVNLYIEKDKSGFELHCISGIPASKIFIDNVDFGTMWRKTKYETQIQNYSHDEQCVMIADYLCTLLCEWIDTTNYKTTLP